MSPFILAAPNPEMATFWLQIVAARTPSPSLKDICKKMKEGRSGTPVHQERWCFLLNSYFPLYWLFNRDPHNGLLQSPHIWVYQLHGHINHVIYTLEN